MTERQPAEPEFTVPGATGEFTVICAPGVVPTAWSRTWAQRMPKVPLNLVYLPAAKALKYLEAGIAQAGLIRAPIDRDRFHAIALYTEVTVAVMHVDNDLTAADSLTGGDLVGEPVFKHPDDVLPWSDQQGSADRPPESFTTWNWQSGAANLGEAISLVATGTGVVVVPLSLARLHARKDLSYRELSGVPQSSVALVWLKPDTSEEMDSFIGIVRGRTVNSTRGQSKPPAPAKPSRPSPTGEKRPGQGQRKKSRGASGRPKRRA